MNFSTATDSLKAVEQKELTLNQARTVAALLKGLNRVDAAKEAGVSFASVKRWLSTDETFKAAIADGRRQAIEEVINRLAAGVNTSLGSLFDIIDDAETPASVRVRAIEVALTNLCRYNEIVTVNDRLATLELKLYAK